MLTQEQIDSFEENGFLLVSKAFDRAETLEVRNKLINLFDSPASEQNEMGIAELPDLYYTHPEFIPFMINEKIMGIVRQLLGENAPVLTRETTSQRGFYPTWHKDTTTVEKYGHTFHKSKEFKMIRLGVYFQDNNEYGGGLSVFAGSHKTEDNFLMPFLKKSLMRRAIEKISPLSDERNPKINPFHHKMVDIPSKVGDLAIFHFRTNHRATLPKIVSINDIPKDKAKISIFNTFGRNNETTEMYNEFLKTRVEPDYNIFRNRKDFSKELFQKSEELNFRLI